MDKNLSDPLQRSSGAQTRRYALLGIIFGFLFPVVATLIKLAQLQMPLNLSNIIALQRTESLLWIIDTAPLFLGMLAGMAGRRQDTLLETNKRLLKDEEDLRVIKANLEQLVIENTSELQRRTEQLRASTYIAQQIAELQDVSTLLSRSVQLISEQGGFYHVGLFLLDERKRLAFLQAASSETGKELIRQGYHVAVEERSAIGLVSEQNRPYYASDVEKNPLLKDSGFPLSRSRAVLPLSVRGNVIGVLDLHSDQTRVFGPGDAEIIQSLAGLVAVSIENVRLLDETQALVKQLEGFTSHQTLEAWRRLTKLQASAYQYTPAGVRQYAGSAESQSVDGGLQMPLTLRGEIIGRITLQRKADSPGWSQGERTLVKKIAAQVALALDNSRLIEDVQKNAQRDQLLASVSSRLRETLDMESIMQSAAHEFVRALNLKEAEVRLGSSLLGSGPDSQKPNV